MNIIFAINTKGYKVNQMIGSAQTANGGMMMADREKVIKGLELLKDFLGDGLPGKRVVFNSYINIVNNAITLLKEQEAEIRQLRLALDIAKGTCKGINVEGR